MALRGMLDRSSPFRNLIALVLAIGISIRFLFWQLHYPIWKHFAVFALFEMPPIKYIGNFQSYYAVRMPFYDLFSAVFYLLSEWFLGIRALTLFSVLVTVVSLPVFYLAVRNFFTERVALFSLLLYALFPKIIVLSAQGYPEAASIAFIIFSLYSLSRAEASESVIWYAASGLFAMVSYLLFVPAVAYGLLVAAYIQLRSPDSVSITTIVPKPSSIAFSVIPGFVGVVYLLFGPIEEVLSTTTGQWSNMKTPLFNAGAEYGIFEKIVRYIGYMYLDVWSFQRGYDKEAGILRKLDSFRAFTGDLFPLAMVGYVLVTLLVSLCIVYGIAALIRRRNLRSMLLIAWISVFVLFHTVRNAGWTGVFQSRHVLPIFPAIFIAFGVGADRIGIRLPAVIEDVRGLSIPLSPTSVTLVFLLCLAPLVGVSTVESVFVGEHHYLADHRPAQRLDSTVATGDDVAVVHRHGYIETVLYTQNSIRPVIYVSNRTARERIERSTIKPRIRVLPPSRLRDAEVEYLYLSECGPLSSSQRRYLRAARNIGTVVYNQTTTRGRGRCTVRVSIVRFLET